MAPGSLPIRKPAETIGVVNSGGFGPSVNAPVAMGYVRASAAGGAAPIYAELRGDRVPLEIAALPFITPTYKR